VTSAVAIELREQLLARERELESRQVAIAAREDGPAAFKHALGRVCMECAASCIQVEAAQQDDLAHPRTPLVPSLTN
jgi:hypothetical protein